MNKSIIIAIIFCLGFLTQLHAQEAEIQKVIETLFDGMKNKNASLVAQCFHPEAMMHTTLSKDNGATLGGNSVQDFINRIATTPAETILDERILSYKINIDGDMASVWTPYEFYVNDNFSHRGVNSFQLIRTAEGWKITYVIDTRRKNS
jgi:hypothetical protein